MKIRSIAFVFGALLGFLGTGSVAQAQAPVRICTPIYNAVTGFLSCPDVGETSAAGNYNQLPVTEWANGAVVSTANPLPIAGTFSASITGFMPSASSARMAPLAVTTADSSGSLPTGTTVVVSNVGANPMYCNVNAIAATTSDELISAGSWFSFTIPATVTTLHCIATGGSTTANGVGGAGLPAGAISGGGGGGGSVTQGTSPWVDDITQWANVALGAPSAYGTSPGAVNVLGVNAYITNTVPVTGAFYQATQPVSAASLPLPSGAATAANQTAIQSAPGTPATTANTVQSADIRATGLTINSATANAAVSVALNGGEGSVGWTISGLTAAGATLTAEGSNDGGTTWSAINTILPVTGGLSPTLTADGQVRVNSGGHTNVRMRVSTTGTGTITIAYNAASVSSMEVLSSSLPTGANGIGQVGGWNFNTSITPTVQNAAYSAGNGMGGVQTFSVFRNTTNPHAVLDQLQITSKGGSTVAMTVYAWTKSPSTTCADKSAMSYNTADNPYLVPGFPVVMTPAVIGSGTTESFAQQAGPYSANNQDSTLTTNLYVCIVANATVTPASTSDLILSLAGIND